MILDTILMLLVVAKNVTMLVDIVKMLILTVIATYVIRHYSLMKTIQRLIL